MRGELAVELGEQRYAVGDAKLCAGDGDLAILPRVRAGDAALPFKALMVGLPTERALDEARSRQLRPDGRKQRARRMCVRHDQEILFNPRGLSRALAGRDQGSAETSR